MPKPRKTTITLPVTFYLENSPEMRRKRRVIHTARVDGVFPFVKADDSAVAGYLRQCIGGGVEVTMGGTDGEDYTYYIAPEGLWFAVEKAHRERLQREARGAKGLTTLGRKPG